MGRDAVMVWAVVLGAWGGGVGAAGDAGRSTADVAPMGSLARADTADVAGMRSFLERAEALGFSGQVLYAEDGRVLLHEAYGWADRDGRVPLTVRTPIGFASVTKQLTAAAVLALRDSGRLRLDDPVGRHLPWLPDDKASITLGQLLTHTGGMPPGDAMGDFEVTDPAALRARLSDVSPVAEPGERWMYSNAGYNLLALVVESVTGSPLDEAMRRLVFDPAGMHSTGLSPAPAPDGTAPARPYVADAGQWTPLGAVWNGRTVGGGNAYGTAADLFAFDRSVREGRLFADSTVSAFHSAHTSIGDPARGDGYGYGLFVRENEREGHVVEHGGDWERGYNAAFFRWDRGRRVLIVVSNGRDHAGFSLRQWVQASLDGLARGRTDVAPLPDVRALDPARARGLVGRHETDRGTVDAWWDGALLWVGAADQEAVDAMVGATEEGAELHRSLNERAAAVARQELAGADGFGPALREDGAPYIDDYRSEWRAVVGPLGTDLRATVLGSVAGGRSAATLLKIEGSEGTAHVTFFWRDGGEGRLGGSQVRPEWMSPRVYPLAFPVAASADGALVGYDPIGERGFRWVPGGATSTLAPLGG